jgi:hypothetical protein
MRIALAAAALVAGGACSGSAGGPDGAPFPPDALDIVCDEGGGEPFDLSVGYLSESSYVEISDGDDTTLVMGPQGIYMLHLESRALLTFADEQICLTCLVAVGPTEAGFAGTEQEGGIVFVQAGADSFGTALNVLLGSRDAADDFADSEADVTMDCNGNGFSGSVERHVVLRLPPS